MADAETPEHDPITPEQTHFLWLPEKTGRAKYKLQRGRTYQRHDPETSQHPIIPLKRSIRADLCPDATSAARLYASRYGVVLALVEGSGEGGRIVLSDVEAYLESE